ncbi:MAG: hypothetical protein INR68_05090 [Methylobacterium mesophilicum]|nr:hypothetical protein [Methylobacterium mesophilicum]
MNAPLLSDPRPCRRAHPTPKNRQVSAVRDPACFEDGVPTERSLLDGAERAGGGIGLSMMARGRSRRDRCGTAPFSKIGPDDGFVPARIGDTVASWKIHAPIRDGVRFTLNL